MRFVVAGGGFAGLAAGLAVARAGHEAVVVERDVVEPGGGPLDAFAADRQGIPHFFQPHAFLPRGRRELAEWAPDVLALLHEAGAEPQDVAAKLRGTPEPGDEDLVYLWVRRPVIEWALRRVAAAQEGVELRAGVDVAGLETNGDKATGVALASGEVVRGDVVVDALGRYRPPAGWPRADAQAEDSGSIYYCRYFALVDGSEHDDTQVLFPRADLGYMAFTVFRGDNRTYAIILTAPSADRELRALRHTAAWEAACAAIPPLAVLASPDHGRPITDVMPMGGLMNTDRTVGPPVRHLAVVGDGLCHTDPALSWGLSLSLMQANALAKAAAENEAAADAYQAAVAEEARERFQLACAIDDARMRRWGGEPLDVTRASGCYPLFALGTTIAAAAHDDEVLRRAVRHIGLLARTAAFDEDAALHARIEEIVASRPAPTPPGPPRDELLAGLTTPR